ncbi:MAG TPA: exodeoxyribonuclease III [Polyangiaceae bacterium]|nr:exodeoxyribonuclease III [Polyangiaceae bacterium]
MRVATWNVNSLRARLDHVERWLSSERPDVLCLQETKVTDAEFPLDTFVRLGYETVRAGQPSYNGVAILARHPISDVSIGLCDAAPDDDKRLIAATIQGVRVLSAYVPNGKSLDSPAYGEKLEWLARLVTTLERTTSASTPIVLGGDFNVAHGPGDVFDPVAMKDQIHFSKPEHEALDRLLAFGLTDAFRAREPGPGHFSWWDYRMSAFRRNRGLRIDYLFVSAPVLHGMQDARIDRAPRTWDKPSDHTPVCVDFELG